MKTKINPPQAGVVIALVAGTGLVLTTTALSPSVASAQTAQLTIESWRNDDLAVWEDIIIPAFEAEHPGIEVRFAPTAPTEYNAALNAKLDGGTAGDLITCRPFDAALALYNKGQLMALDDIETLANFSDVAKTAWQTDDGGTTFCMPMASVIHGFIYNAEAFEELGITPPETESEFFAMLDAIKQDGSYTPLVMGTADQWEAATMGYQNIGPNYWRGEEGRLAVIAGEQALTDDPWVAPMRTLARWKDYLAPGYEAQTYPDSQNLFTLGRGAIYPSGSWEIGLFNEQADFEMGAFPPPRPDGAEGCYISDHTDIGLGINAATEHPEAARTFVEWVGTAEFAELYSNALPGFFSLNSAPITLEDPLAQEFLSWREECESTIRSGHQILSRGNPNLWNAMWGVSANVVNGTMTPEEAAEELQSGLAGWYEPQQGN
ncbi:MAG: ABC transporter substrate-binding protein [Inquilinaceae bacterium]